MPSYAPPRYRWVHYAACAWAVLFGAPHLWWALGLSAGFPGGRVNHQLMLTTWRYYGNLIVVALSIAGVFVALLPVHRWSECIPGWLLRTAAWIAFGLLMLRGVAGMIVDGTSDPLWWPTFLIGGLLFGAIAWTTRAQRQMGDEE